MRREEYVVVPGGVALACDGEIQVPTITGRVGVLYERIAGQVLAHGDADMVRDVMRTVSDAIAPDRRHVLEMVEIPAKHLTPSKLKEVNRMLRSPGSAVYFAQRRSGGTGLDPYRGTHLDLIV